MKFLLYNADNEPIGQFESDDQGYIWIRKELPEGKYKYSEDRFVMTICPTSMVFSHVISVVFPFCT